MLSILRPVRVHACPNALPAAVTHEVSERSEHGAACRLGVGAGVTSSLGGYVVRSSAISAYWVAK